MNRKTKFILIFLAAVAIIIFFCGNRDDPSKQKERVANPLPQDNAAIPITSSKKENEIIIGGDDDAIIIKEGEEIIVGE